MTETKPRFTWYALLRPFLWLGDAFAIGIVLYFILRFTIAESFGLVAFTNVLLHWLMLPVFGFLVLSFFGRFRPRIAYLGVLAVIYLILFGGLFIPRTAVSSADASAETITFVTHNVSFDHTIPEDFAAFVDEYDVDVFGLVENSEWVGGDLEKLLAETHPYTINIGDGIEGKGFFSRYPIIEQEIFTMATDRPNLYAKIDIDGQPLNVYVFHPPAPDFEPMPPSFSVAPEHPAEIEGILARVSSDEPTVLLGDFNLTDQTPPYRDIKQAGFTDSYRAVGFGFGNTYSLMGMGPPLTRIDYVWLSPHLQPIESLVGPEMLSDHRPLITRARWTTQ